MPLEAWEEPDRGDEPTGPGQEPVERDAVVLLLVEQRRVAANLWRELIRHRDEHGCGVDSCELRLTLAQAWCSVDEMAKALDFLALGEIPSCYHTGYDAAGWLKEYVAGPWRSLDEPSELRP